MMSPLGAQQILIFSKPLQLLVLVGGFYYYQLKR